MGFLSLQPEKSTFHPGEQVKIQATWEGCNSHGTKLVYKIFHGEKEIQKGEKSIEESRYNSGSICIALELPDSDRAGYGICASINDGTGKILAAGSTAFDILPDWTHWPRYGYLTNFSAGRTEEDICRVMQNLSDFHINGLQFYDWQYRHDDFIAPTEDFIDPLGRKLSLATVRNLIDEAHEKNIASMPYTTVYAASVKYSEANPAQALYDSDGKAIMFGDNFLGLMDPSRGSGWVSHLIDQFNRILNELNFDGIHIDQYGDPKTAFNSKREMVDLPQAFVDLIKVTHELRGSTTTLFNAVGNWPIDALAQSDIAFPYIEIWPPDVRYLDMIQVITNARKLSGGKPVVLAQYISSKHPANVIMASTLAMACGCCRIELGEDLRLLSDPYFPKNEAISDKTRQLLKQNYDFYVCYGEWIEKSNKEEEITQLPSEVFFRKYRDEKGVIINLVNMTGIGWDTSWNSQHEDVTGKANISIKLELGYEPKVVLFATTDDLNIGMKQISYKYEDGMVMIDVPELTRWGLVDIRYE